MQFMRILNYSSKRQTEYSSQRVLKDKEDDKLIIKVQQDLQKYLFKQSITSKQDKYLAHVH